MPLDPDEREQLQGPLPVLGPPAAAKPGRARPSAKPLRVVSGNTVRKPAADEEAWQEF